MAVITDIKGQYFYIHNNPDSLNGSFQKITLLDKEKTILAKCILVQKTREQKVLKMAKATTVENLYEILFGIKTGDKKENDLDQCLRILQQYFIDVFSYNGVSVFDKKFKYESGISKKIINSFYNIKKDLSRWLIDNNINEQNINLELIHNILDKTVPVFNEKMKEQTGIDFNIKEENGIMKIDGNINSNGVEEILKKIFDQYKPAAYGFFGDLSEAGTVYCKNVGTDIILHRMSTSDWYTKRDSNSNNLPLEIQYKNIYSKYKKEIEKLRNRLISDNVVTENFSIKSSSFVKADEIFAFQTTINGNEELFTFGISNKMAASENSSLKIQDTSLSAILSNIYILNSFGDVEYISKAIQFILVNTSGLLDWDHLYGRGKREVDIKIGDGPTTIEKILRQLVSSFAYLWFTGGSVMGSAHADYFLITKNGKTYFIPFSLILEKILKNLEEEDSYFSAIGFNKEPINKNKFDNLKKAKLLIKNDKFYSSLNTDMKEIFKESMGKINKPTLISIRDYTNLI